MPKNKDLSFSKYEVILTSGYCKPPLEYHIYCDDIKDTSDQIKMYVYIGKRRVLHRSAYKDDFIKIQIINLWDGITTIIKEK